MNDLLRIENMSVDFRLSGARRRQFRAVDDVTLSVARGETLGLVGESGSGKSTIGRAILGLVPISAGTVRFNGHDITNVSRTRRRKLAADLQVVFQDPYSSLNPAMTIGDILAEPITAGGGDRRAASARVRDLLTSVGLPPDVDSRYSRQFSGGQRQRIAIARALALEPQLIVCDEPVSALDLTTQATVLDLFIDIQRRTGVAYLFISHDLGVIRHISHRVAVMQSGRIVEVGDGPRVTGDPEHPYTKRLLLASPVPDPVAQAQRRARRHRLLTRDTESAPEATLVPPAP